MPARAKYVVADVYAGLAMLPDASVDLVMTSPPFLALRSYLPADHPDKASEIGSEPTPGAFIDALLDVVVELRRVLAPHGSLVFELGDTYAGSGGAGGDYSDNPQAMRQGQPGFDGAAKRSRQFQGANKAVKPGTSQRLQSGPAWPLDKSLALIPQSFAWALSYGRNPFTGREIEPWRVRNVVAWCRPNPPVGALGDKFRPATSYLTVACTARDRYFDLDAVRQPYSELTMKVKGEEWASGERGFKTGPKAASGETGRPMAESRSTHAGAPPLDYWVIPTQPFKGSHYATYPEKLCIRPILAMCPLKVCRLCGEPSRRIVGKAEYIGRDGELTEGAEAWRHGRRGDDPGAGQRTVDTMSRSATTLGWTHCACGQGCTPTAYERVPTGKLTAKGNPKLQTVCTDPGNCADPEHYRPGLVLDPFAGSGTTLKVANEHERNALGFDLDARNAELARQRVGDHLEVLP